MSRRRGGLVKRLSLAWVDTSVGGEYGGNEEEEEGLDVHRDAHADSCNVSVGRET